MTVPRTPRPEDRADVEAGGAAGPPTATDLAHQAAEAVRALSDATLTTGPGLRYPVDVYRTLGWLVTLAHGLPQALEQLTSFLQQQHAGGQVALDAGTEFAGDPGRAVSTATACMEIGGQLADQLGAALDRATQALAFASFVSSTAPPSPVGLVEPSPFPDRPR